MPAAVRDLLEIKAMPRERRFRVQRVAPALCRADHHRMTSGVASRPTKNRIRTNFFKSELHCVFLNSRIEHVVGNITRLICLPVLRMMPVNPLILQTARDA